MWSQLVAFAVKTFLSIDLWLSSNSNIRENNVQPVRKQEFVQQNFVLFSDNSQSLLQITHTQNKKNPPHRSTRRLCCKCLRFSNVECTVLSIPKGDQKSLLYSRHARLHQTSELHTTPQNHRSACTRSSIWTRTSEKASPTFALSYCTTARFWQWNFCITWRWRVQKNWCIAQLCSSTRCLVITNQTESVVDQNKTDVELGTNWQGNQHPGAGWKVRQNFWTQSRFQLALKSGQRYQNDLSELPTQGVKRTWSRDREFRSTANWTAAQCVWYLVNFPDLHKRWRTRSRTRPIGRTTHGKVSWDHTSLTRRMRWAARIATLWWNSTQMAITTTTHPSELANV